MVRLFIRRLAQAVPLVLAISMVTFVAVHLAPGDPLTGLLENPHISPETVEAIRHRLGLDLPLSRRYLRWLSHALQGDFGYSIEYLTPISALLPTRILNTLILSLTASGIAWAVGVPLGIIAAVGQNRWIGRAHTLFVTLALATPRIFLALLALGLAATTGWFPIGGMRAVAGEAADWMSRTADLLHHLVLPALVLSLSPMAMISGHLRAALSEVVSLDFIRTARAKGLPRRVILRNHALRNALGPLLMLLGYSIGNLLSGSAVVETVMAWPGIGRLTVEAVFARDSDLILATVVLASVLLIVGNLIADVVLLTVDPRVRIRA
ncbi:MAG TPA: ABC transporter permease [Blastocatellia bacterium]|nr:ABC transporter permease [Blastocatellia bacterium]